MLLIGLSRNGGVTFNRSDIYALDGETNGLAAELIEGRYNGWWPQSEWDKARRMVESIYTAQQQQ